MWGPAIPHPRGEWSSVKISGDLVWGKRGGEEEEAERERKTKKQKRTDFTLQHTVPLQTKRSLKFLLHPTKLCLPYRPTRCKSFLDATYSTRCHVNCPSGAPVSLQPHLGPARPGTRHLALGSSQHARLPHPLPRSLLAPHTRADQGAPSEAASRQPAAVDA